MGTDTEKFFSELQAAVEEDRLELPSLPDVALRIRDVAENEDTTTGDIADILSQDGALSARLLKIVNSPLYRTRVPIDDLHMAVTRMGCNLVRDLVTNLAMKQMYQPTSVMMEKQFREAWKTSVDIASICQMMAATMEVGVRKEQALLAGLLHNIGLLPILLMAENDDYLFHDEQALSELTQELQGRVGAIILQSWHFSEDLIEVVTQCHNFQYEHEGSANLVDLVQFTLLQGGFIASDRCPEDWSSIPAFAKLGMEAEMDIIHVEENQEMLNDARQSLMI